MLQHVGDEERDAVARVVCSSACGRRAISDAISSIVKPRKASSDVRRGLGVVSGVGAMIGGDDMALMAPCYSSRGRAGAGAEARYGTMRTPVGAAGGPVGVVPRGMTNSVTLCAGSVAVSACAAETGTSASRVIAFADVSCHACAGRAVREVGQR